MRRTGETESMGTEPRRIQLANGAGLRMAKALIPGPKSTVSSALSVVIVVWPNLYASGLRLAEILVWLPERAVSSCPW